MFDYRTFFYVEKCKDDGYLDDFLSDLLEKIIEVV